MEGGGEDCWVGWLLDCLNETAKRPFRSWSKGTLGGWLPGLGVGVEIELVGVRSEIDGVALVQELVLHIALDELLGEDVSL